MGEKIRGHIRSNVIGYVALFVALSGTAYAVDGPLEGQNQVGSADIINNEVQSADIKDANLTNADIRVDAVTTGKIANGAVTSPKIAGVMGAAFTDAGLPAGLQGCVEGTNLWQDLSSNVNNEAGYYRDPLGIVHLHGIAVKCGSPPSGDTIFTLPAGYHPAKLEHQPAVYSTGVKEVNIDPAGNVSAANAPSANEWVSLDGITFRCAPSGSNGCP
jgi:hypothetical protein